MRERERERYEARRQYLEEHPEEIEAERAKMREKYRKIQDKKKTKALMELAEKAMDEKVKDAIKVLIDTQACGSVSNKLIKHFESAVNT